MQKQWLIFITQYLFDLFVFLCSPEVNNVSHIVGIAVVIPNSGTFDS